MLWKVASGKKLGKPCCRCATILHRPSHENRKGEKRGLKRISTHQSFKPPSIPGTIESKPCSVDGVQAQFEISLVCAIRRLLRQGFTFLHRITASDRESEPDRYFNIRLKVVSHLQVTGVRTSLFAITRRRLYSQPFLNNRLRGRRQVYSISRYEFELHDMVNGSESGVNPPRNMARETARPAEYLMEYISGLSSRLRPLA
jgi:hypothetical protein